MRSLKFHKPQPRKPTEASPFARVLGVCCGAFVLCFVSILVTVALGIFGKPAGLIWLAALCFGAVGGGVFPRLGHFSAYAFVIFMNVMLAITIGANPPEQIKLFAIFTAVELMFFVSRFMLKRA